LLRASALPAHAVVVLGVAGAGETADVVEAAVDFLIGDKTGEELPGRHPFTIDGHGPVQAQGLDHFTERHLDVAAANAAVAARRSLAGAQGIEDNHGTPGPGQGQRRVQASVAGPDDAYIRPLRDSGGFRLGQGGSLPPIGFQFEIGIAGGGGHGIDSICDDNIL
jgi:hypothetical protein